MSSVELQTLLAKLGHLYIELTEIERQILPIISRLRSVIGEILGAEQVRPVATPVRAEAEVHVAAPSRLIMPAERPRAAPEVRRGVTLDDVYAVLVEIKEELESGLRRRPFRDHRFVRAPNPITYEGNSFDLGDTYHTAMIVPTVDAQIEINRKVEPTTPEVKAFSALNISDTAIRTIHYKSTSPELRGELLLWLLKY